MRIAVCDDNQHFVKELSEMIANTYQSLDLLIDSFCCGEDIVSHYRNGRVVFDVILLDIEMNEMDGLKTAEIIHKIAPDTIIIFVTSHIELALAGYEVSAFRFLAKPLNAPKLFEALEAVKAQMKSEKIIHIKNAEGEFAVPVRDIFFMEAKGQQTEIKTKGKIISHRHNISHYVTELEKYDFVSVHRSYLINLQYVKRFTKQEVILEGNIEIPISRLRYQRFRQQFHHYISMTSM